MRLFVIALLVSAAGWAEAEEPLSLEEPITPCVPAGPKIYAIRPGSIVHRLGIENGDYLVGLNGKPIDPTDEKLVDQLRSARRLSLDIDGS